MNASTPPVLPDHRLAAGVARLALRYRGHFCPETIQHVLTDSYDRLAAHAHVRTHLVVLAEHLTTERLDALAHIQGAPGTGLPRVLFVCSLPHARTTSRGGTPIAGRSQLAAALLAHRAAGRVVVSSAGPRPAPEVAPVVAQVLAEAGVDLTETAFPKPLTEEVVQAADIIITMGCDDACPIVPGRRYLDWPVADPEGAPIDVVRDIREEIDTHVTELLDSLPAT
ncbi:low molecular weight phosphatase family protein [Streptomyces sp. PSKA30]|uniref:arsenate-mycothiol transferase ArsC n=1 Tax=Streptomyces sp. PSKA30 TaxID=2874597 RepID=UPI001CD05F4E|nr:arsenate reductase ArsC [Streptomyces sp. PSKA30]MBZ9638084.1 arsenate reductase ArsC [Streptomyces sp. PSKA30]